MKSVRGASENKELLAASYVEGTMLVMDKRGKDFLVESYFDILELSRTNGPWPVDWYETLGQMEMEVIRLFPEANWLLLRELHLHRRHCHG